MSPAKGKNGTLSRKCNGKENEFDLNFEGNNSSKYIILESKSEMYIWSITKCSYQVH